MPAKKSGRSSRRSKPSKPSKPYVHPVPSRDEILAALREIGVPIGIQALGKHFGMRSQSHLEAFERRLRAMVRDGQLIKNRAREYCLLDRLDLITGVVQAHRDGFGFLIPDEGGEDIYLSAREMHSLFDGDRCAVRVAGTDRRGRKEGRLVEILARGVSELVGKFARERGIDLVVPDNPRLNAVLIPRTARGGAKPGDWVKIEIVEFPTKRTEAIGKVVAVLGDDDSPFIRIDAALLSHSIPFEWSAEVTAAVAELKPTVPAKAKQDREDLRELPLVTIDGADARDFDDAVFCEPVKKGGWRLIVAIADVAHYVQQKSALDNEAQSRGTSVYFPGRVIPMLPEVLSNGLCSLNPKVDRLCMACEMTVSPTGKVTGSRFFNSVMRSHRRLTYTEAFDILEESKASKVAGPVVEVLHDLRDVYHAFVAARRRRGALDFDLPAVKFILDDKGEITSVKPEHRVVTHKIIEECMIAANVEAARFLGRQRIPALYRVHEGPKDDKLDELKIFLATFGLKARGGRDLTPKDINHVLTQVAGEPAAELIENVVLRSMTKAVYQPKNVGHFGLALTGYAHFTSPIRRYPDLLVHRAIKHVLKTGGARRYGYSMVEMQSLGETCSRFERRADEAVWDVEEQLKCEYMSGRIGEQYEAVVSGVVGFGLFVRVTELGIDGLVHVTSLPHDYYHFDAGKHTLSGEKGGRVYQLMDKLSVRLAKVNVEERKIDFQLEDTEVEVPTKRGKGTGRGKSTKRGKQRRRG